MMTIDFKRVKMAVQMNFVPSINSQGKSIRRDLTSNINSKIELLKGYKKHLPQQVIDEVNEFLLKRKIIVKENTFSVSFDFDGCLSLPQVQDYCKDLIFKGYEIYVTTFRYNQMLKHLYPSKPHNHDLYEVTDRLGIPRENIVFTNNKPKSSYLMDSKCLFHIDDEIGAITDVRNNTKLNSVDVTKTDWKKNCEIFLRNYHASI